MPELPEVETIRRQLDKEIVGKRIVRVTFDKPKMLRPSPDKFRKAVEGRIIRKVERRAKLLFFRLDSDTVFTTHLKLTGRLLLRKASDPADDYVHVTLHFADGYELRFSNMRMFGFMEVSESRQQIEARVSQYGPEPLDDLTREGFYEILQGTRRRIKDVLMDQKTISGIGNIYANDALWMAKIHPETPANRLTHKGSDELFEAIESVLEEALDAGGASDQWYRQIHGEEGHYQKHFKVYSRRGESCPRHPDTKINYSRVGQRGTFYCPKCQREQ